MMKFGFIEGCKIVDETEITIKRLRLQIYFSIGEKL